MQSRFLRRALSPMLLAAATAALLALVAFATAQQTPAATDLQSPTPSQATAPQPALPVYTPPAAPATGDITEEQLKQRLVGKTFYLRGGFLDDSLKFNERGVLSGQSPKGSYTLSLIQIGRIRLLKHKVEIEGVRYALHFLGALPYEDPDKAFDKVRITPKKKTVHITIDREQVVKPKMVKPEKPKSEKPGKSRAKVQPATEAAQPAAPTSTPVAAASHAAPPETSTAPAPEPVEAPAAAAEAPAPEPAPSAGEQAAPATEQAPAQADDDSAPELSPAEQLKAAIAAEPEADRPADPKSMTTTTSPAHAAQLLDTALDSIFAPGLDARMMAAMPDFWKLYYQAQSARSDYRPTDPKVLRQSNVDKKARLVSAFEPESNQWAQENGVAGMALYHAVIGPDGKIQEIAVGRPIGFGLDENAVDDIRKAKFEPAIKNGQPVAVLLDLVVQFRIYSKRTAALAAPKPAAESEEKKPSEPVLPGPYSVQHPPQ